MPTYVYSREDGTTFECIQRITDDPLTVCPETGQPVRRVIQSPNFQMGGIFSDYIKDNKGREHKVIRRIGGWKRYE